MEKNICIFEGQNCYQFHPLTYFRPVYDLRCGILTIRQKIEKYFPGVPLHLNCRTYLEAFMREQNPGISINDVPPGECLFIDGSTLMDAGFADLVEKNPGEMLFMAGAKAVAARMKYETFKALLPDASGFISLDAAAPLPVCKTNAKRVEYPWELVHNNGDQIIADYHLLRGTDSNGIHGSVYSGAVIINEAAVFIGNGAKVKPGVVIDAEDGPVFIDEGAHIMPNSTIIGPAFIGKKSAIKIGAKIYENTSIGEICKVGGEVEGSIIHSFSNKQHDGFLGHAYLAKWVNLGADTNNSDLKNNYGNVRVKINGEEIDSGSMFVGLIMGDHSKSAINSMFNTGTVVGVSSNVFGAGFPPKYIPSFAWGGAGSMDTYNIEKALFVAKKVMGRRNISLSETEEALFRHIFSITTEERQKFIS